MSDYLKSHVFKDAPQEYAEFVIPRDGKRSFRGRMRLIADGSVCGTGITNRTYVFQRERGGYIVAREHLTIWEGARDGHNAELADTAEALFKALGGDAMNRVDEDAWVEVCQSQPACAALSHIEV